MSGVDVHVFRDSIAKIVRALTDSKIAVKQQGMKAKVDYDSKGRPLRVVLPSIPDDAPADLLNAIQGFLDHEVSHVLHTNFPYTARRQKKAHEDGELLRETLWNIVEDVYVEKAMARKFTGSMLNLENIQRYLCQKSLGPAYEKFKAEGDAKKLRSVLLAPAIRAAGGQPVFQQFMRDKWDDVGHLREAIEANGSAIAAIESTKDSWAIADSIYETVQKESKKKSKKEEGESGSESGDSEGSEDAPKRQKKTDKGTSSDEKSDDSADGKPDGSEDAEDSDDEDRSENRSDGGKDSDDNGDEESEDSDDDERSDNEDAAPSSDGDESDDDEGSDKGDDEDDPQDDSSDPDDSDDSDTPSRSEGDRDYHAGAMGDCDNEDIDLDLVKPAEDLASELIERAIEEHRALNPEDYVPFSRDLDYLGPFPLVERFQELSLADSQVTKLAHETAHVIQGEVERIFRARSASRWAPGQRRGKISRNSLHRVTMNDDRVFRQKIVVQSREIAVQLVIDCSGSMYGQKVLHASTAAYMLAMILDRINVPLEMVGFTTTSHPINEHCTPKDLHSVSEAYMSERYAGYTSYARYEPIATFVFKDFKQRFDDTVKKTIAYLPTASSCMRNNVDGESIEIAAMRLAQRKEPRKIMIVMSDGQPACDGPQEFSVRKLTQVVKDIELSGIEVYGLGLLSNAVKQYYSKNEVISAANEIPTKVLALIQQLLVK